MSQPLTIEHLVSLIDVDEAVRQKVLKTVVAGQPWTKVVKFTSRVWTTRLALLDDKSNHWAHNLTVSTGAVHTKVDNNGCRADLIPLPTCPHRRTDVRTLTKRSSSTWNSSSAFVTGVWGGSVAGADTEFESPSSSTKGGKGPLLSKP